MSSYSISVRVQRTTVEQAYVSVPVTGAVMQAEPAADGSYRLDGAKLFAAAVELGRSVATWQLEERQVSVHPIQGPDDSRDREDQLPEQST